MTEAEVKQVIETLKSQGCDEEEILGSFYKMFQDDKINFDQLEALTEALGWHITDEFRNMSDEDKKTKGYEEVEVEDETLTEVDEEISEEEKNLRVFVEFMQDKPYFMTNNEWYYFDEEEFKYMLTDKAPKEALLSYEEFYKEFEEFNEVCKRIATELDEDFDKSSSLDVKESVDEQVNKSLNTKKEEHTTAKQRQMDYMNKWQKEKCRRFVLALNRDSQGDVIEFLEKNAPFTTFVVETVRKIIKEQGAQENECPNCKSKLNAGVKFCSECGTKIEVVKNKFCTECGAKLLLKDKFCSKCGTKAH